MIKSITALLLICSLLAFTACNAAPQEQTTSPAATEQTLTAATTTQTTTATSTETTAEVTTTIPPANIRPIRSILLYTYNAYAAASAYYGYHFYYFTPELIASGRTQNTPINTENPLSTENMELTVSVVPSEDNFETICENMWECRFDRLPARLDADRDIYMDHSEFYLTVTFEDGSCLTSSGYAAPSISSTYRQVVNVLDARIQKEQKDG